MTEEVRQHVSVLNIITRAQKTSFLPLPSTRTIAPENQEQSTVQSHDWNLALGRLNAKRLVIWTGVLPL